MQSHFSLPTSETHARRERAVNAMRVDKLPEKVGSDFRSALLNLLGEMHYRYLSVPVDAAEPTRQAFFHVTNHQPVVKVFTAFYQSLRRYILEKIRTTATSMRVTGADDRRRELQKARTFLERDFQFLENLAKKDPVAEQVLELTVIYRALFFYTLQFSAYSNAEYPSLYMTPPTEPAGMSDYYHEFLAYYFRKKNIVATLHKSAPMKAKESFEGGSFFHDWVRWSALVQSFHGKSDEEVTQTMTHMKRDFIPMEMGIADRERTLKNEAELVQKLTKEDASLYMHVSKDALAVKMAQLTPHLSVLENISRLSAEELDMLQSYLPRCTYRHFSFELMPGTGMTEGRVRFAVHDQRDNLYYEHTLELALNPPCVRIEQYPYLDLDEESAFVGLGTPFRALGMHLLERALELVDAYQTLYAEEECTEEDCGSTMQKDPLGKWLDGIHSKYHAQLRRAMQDVIDNNLASYKQVDIRAEKNLRRIRVGGYRIVFERNGSYNTIVEVGARQDVYRKWGG
ncbi:hypothetical protein COW46_03650 [Candidatus Gracilibacteria bacterium CG17_big_fil_post_rev_8_21_14_2_50_48_13]|nr:MAG: hypothetical protein COW46_03650 [Candidatus Gracilibacteria bacterium CG17_big_fil_post_rev_8_21_14_2_50_48_13]